VLLVAPARGDWAAPIVRVAAATAMTRVGRQRMIPFLAAVNRDDLLVLKAWLEAGTIRPLIDRTYPLEETAAALRHVEAGHVQGKVVITV
jgi:NADPH:quinone reductase-like Zn-dependent oxidoreductase